MEIAAAQCGTSPQWGKEIRTLLNDTSWDGIGDAADRPTSFALWGGLNLPDYPIDPRNLLTHRLTWAHPPLSNSIPFPYSLRIVAPNFTLGGLSKSPRAATAAHFLPRRRCRGVWKTSGIRPRPGRARARMQIVDGWAPR